MKWHKETLRALIRDIALARLRQLRPSERIPLDSLGEDMLDPHHYPNLDSLEVFQVAGDVATFFTLHNTASESKLLTKLNIEHWCEVIMASRTRDDAGLTFHTSGSCGQPKAVTHPLASLERESAHWAHIFSGHDAISGNIPRHHIYGFLFSVLLPRRLNLTYRERRSELPQSTFVDNSPKHLLITLPHHLKLFLDSGQTASQGLTAVTSTAPLPTAWARLALARNVDRLMHIYGSTETRGLAVRRNAEDYFELLPFIEKDHAGTLVYRAPGGDKHRLDVQDQLRFIDDRRLRIGRRQDQAVQVGGYNVSLGQVGQKIKACPLVGEIAIRTYDSPLGVRLKAFVVPTLERYDQDQLRDQLAAYIRAHLPTEERPTAITLGARLPRNAHGKLADWPPLKP